MHGKVIVVDYEKCTGCRQCELVCSVFHSGASNPARSRIRVVKWEQEGIYLPMTCQNCEKPFCVEVCPTKACSIDKENQRVVIDAEKCIGCKTCIVACPFGAPSYDHVDKVSIKCDYCDGTPQCAYFCTLKAIEYVSAESLGMPKKRDAARRICDAARKEK